jgi:membrane fusion protein, heavy metal efflux system
MSLMKNLIIPGLIVGLLVLSACAPENNESHEHDPVALYFTGYGENLEVFAEADPFATGTSSSILVHITHLSDFKPLEKGRVTASVITGNRGVRQTLEDPIRPGIFQFLLQPEIAGESRLVIDVEWDGNKETIEGGRLMVFETHHLALHEAENLDVEIPGAVVFTKEQSWAVSFSTGLVTSQHFGSVIKTVGEVLPARGDEAILTARAGGIIHFPSGSLYEGVAVSAGETLLEVTGGAMADNNVSVRFQEARNRYERSRMDYERISRLAEEKLVSEREMLMARQEYLDASAAYENLSETYSIEGHAQKSPVSGFLSQLLVDQGEYVVAGQALAVISGNRSLVIRAQVQQRYAELLGDIMDANISLADGTMQPLAAFNGSIVSVARNIHPETHMLPVHLQVQGGKGLLPGGLTDVYLKTGADRPVLVVPNTALIEEQGNFFVFVQNHPERFVKREVQTGQTDGIQTVVTGGLAEGERIVTRGAVMVKMAASAGDLDPHSGHVH